MQFLLYSWSVEEEVLKASCWSLWFNFWNVCFHGGKIYFWM